MSNIPSIPTRYKGYHFRSRLEARWAVFFDSLGIKWEYEPEGFMNADGDKYLPDFYLSQTHTWVEVKGDEEALCKDWLRMTNLLDYGGVIPEFENSFKTDGRGLLLLGTVPEGNVGEYYVHPILQHHKGIIKNWCYFDCIGTLDFDLPGSCKVTPGYSLKTEPKNWIVETKSFPRDYLNYSKSMNATHDAYAAARSARFEHGESGAT